MDKLHFPLTLSPEAVEALRKLIYGDTKDASPSLREMQRVLDESGCSEQDRVDLLLVLGLEDERTHAHRQPTRPPMAATPLPPLPRGRRDP
jgi:hypothetical protein